jgi:surface antigen
MWENCGCDGRRGVGSTMTVYRMALLALVPVVLVGCGPDGPSKQDSGLVVGAVAGGLLGSAVGRGNGRIFSTALGAVVGGIVGSEIGRSMDKQDRILAQQAELAAFEQGPTGKAVPWRNPDNGRYGEVVPGSPYRRGPDDCRDYTHTIYIDGRPQTMRGTACRNSDGSWRSV